MKWEGHKGEMMMRNILHKFVVVSLSLWLTGNIYRLTSAEEANPSGVYLKGEVLSTERVIWEEEFKEKLSERWRCEGTFRLEERQFVAESKVNLTVSLKEEQGEIAGWWWIGTGGGVTVFSIKQGLNHLQAKVNPSSNGLNISCEIQGEDPLGYSRDKIRTIEVSVYSQPTMRYWSQAEKDEVSATLKKLPKYYEVWKQWRFVWDSKEVSFWFNGRFIASMKSDRGPLQLSLELQIDDRLRAIQSVGYSTTDRDYLPLDLSAYYNDRSEVFKGVDLKSFPKTIGQVQFHSVPFQISTPLPGAPDHVDLSVAKWRRSPGDIYNQAEAGVNGQDHLDAFDGDPAKVVLRVPKDYYINLYVLAFSKPSKDRTSAFSLRMGDFMRGFLYMQTAIVPSWNVEPKEVPDNCWPVGDSGLWVVRVKLNPAEIQHVLRLLESEQPWKEIQHDWVDIDLNRDLGLFRAYPDPYSCSQVPLGLPSGVKLLAATLERSPVEMFVDSGELGHIFMKDQTPIFNVRLKNRTQDEQHLRLYAKVEDYYGQSTSKERKINLPPEAEETIKMDLSQTIWGHFKVKFDLYSIQSRPRLEIPRSGEELLMSRSTSFAHLAHELAPAHPKSCYGIYTCMVVHYSCPSFEAIALLMEKAGFRWSGTLAVEDEKTAEIAKKYGVMQSQYQAIGYDFPTEPWEGSKKFNLQQIIEKERRMTWIDAWTLLHEHYRLSPERYQFRYPDPVLGKAPPALTKEELEGEVGQIFKNLVEYCKRTKEARPDTRIIFGHSNPSTDMVWFMQGFDRRYFDVYGLEPMMRMRMPERQPDMAGPRSYWAQEVLKYFGMPDTPLWTHEVGFYPTGPGWQTELDQADMSVRFHLCHLAFPQFERFSDAGMLMDYAGYYGYSGWGPSGYLHHYPECNPKPAYVSIATMIRMLDGPVGDLPRPQILKILDMGSSSLFGLKFNTHSNGIVHVFWTLDGERPVTFSLAKDKEKVRLTDAMGNVKELKLSDRRLTLTLTPSPVYVQDLGEVKGVEPGTPRYFNRPGPRREEVDSLENATSWRVLSAEETKKITSEAARPTDQEEVPEPTLGIDQTKADIIRRMGNFKIEIVPDEEMNARVWEIIPQPAEGHPLIPMYQIFKRDKPLVVDWPRERIGIWVKGNSGWGRIMFGFTDAKGNKWLSMEVKDDWNTEDTTSETWIHFDGWRYIDMGLPAFYADGIQKSTMEKWRYTGNREVVYPIKIDTLIVQLQEEIVYLNKTIPVQPKSIRLKGLTVSD